MKRVIRKGVFETNSSSMHSIVVMKNDVNIENQNDNVWIKDGKLQVFNSDLRFGRSPFEILSTAERKLHYAMASSALTLLHVAKDGNYDEYFSNKLREFDSIASKVFENCVGIDYPTIPNGRNGRKWEQFDFGYVDHDSSELLTHFLDKEGISLYEFVSNPKYIVVIDGDEYCVLNTMKHSGLININNIEREYCLDTYSYEFVHEEDKK